MTLDEFANLVAAANTTHRETPQDEREAMQYTDEDVERIMWEEAEAAFAKRRGHAISSP